jgi:N6-adenosine-specific RNA methylase IME4
MTGPDRIESHPLAEIFPLLEGEAFAELIKDIAAKGLHEPIVLHEGRILDGRNRYRGCQEAGVAPRFEIYTGADPLGYFISLNLKRRHLDESQRAMVAARIATLQLGANQHTRGSENLPTQVQAAELLNVSDRSVRSARTVQAAGASELVEAVDRGDLKVSVAANIATLSKEEQRAILANLDQREILNVAKDIRAQHMEQRHAERIKRLAKISEGSAALPTGQRFPVIYADPPWYFEVYDSVSGTARTPDAYYPCMSTEEICALSVCELATDDAALFLWTTAPHLQESFRVIEAWGFRYTTNIAWMKDKAGLGYWVRNQHELLLIATRGSMPSPAPSRRPTSIIQSPRREHSRKPDEAHALIERMYPDLPKIELFARGTRAGWAAWGNQAGEAAA